MQFYSSAAKRDVTLMSVSETFVPGHQEVELNHLCAFVNPLVDNKLNSIGGRCIGGRCHCGAERFTTMVAR